MLPLDEHLRTQLELLHTLFPDAKKEREMREKRQQEQKQKDSQK
jgi:hypothetical protein